MVAVVKNGCGHKKKEGDKAHKCGGKNGCGHKKKEAKKEHKCGKNGCGKNGCGHK